ncbi:MAG: hypothetical protein Q8R02_10745 [Hyphomonadaceae bacterium]|nr:hypothetical protein [Hyphomonadaceae bacterium]
MKRLIVAASFAVLAGCVSPGMGGMSNGGMANSVQQRQMQGDDLIASMDAAEAAAKRPGDDALTCDQMQAEMTAMFQDPKFVATVASLQTQGEQMQTKAKAAQAGAVTSVLAGTALGAASSFVPGLSWLSGGFMQAQMASANKQMESVNRDSDSLMSGMSEIMPQMMRGQRLNELATSKTCAFLNQKPT